MVLASFFTLNFFFFIYKLIGEFVCDGKWTVEKEEAFLEVGHFLLRKVFD